MILDPTMISTVGFPIALICYLLFRFEKKLDLNTKATHDLTAWLKNGGNPNGRRRK